MAGNTTSRRNVNRDLEENLNLRNLLDEVEAREINAGVGEIVTELWIDVIKVIKSGVKDVRRISQALSLISKRHFDRLDRHVTDGFDEYVEHSWQRSWDCWAAALPAEYWWFYHEPPGDEDLAEGLPWVHNKQIDITKHSRLRAIPGVKERKPSKAERPTKEEIQKIFQRDAWKTRLKRWSSLITDPNGIAQKISEGLAKGKSHDEIAQSIMSKVSGVASSAKRIVRTEAARISNELTEAKFKEYDDVIEGYRIIAILDDATRPEHRKRHGSIWYKKPKKGQLNAATRPKLPDEPNCRCTYTAVIDQSDDALNMKKQKTFIIKSMNDAMILSMDPADVAGLPPGKKAKYDIRIKKILAKYNTLDNAKAKIFGALIPGATPPPAPVSKIPELKSPSAVTGYVPGGNISIASFEKHIGITKKTQKYIDDNFTNPAKDHPVTVTMFDGKEIPPNMHPSGKTGVVGTYMGSKSSIYMSVDNYFLLSAPQNMLGTGNFGATKGEGATYAHEYGHHVQNVLQKEGKLGNWYKLQSVSDVVSGKQVNVSTYANSSEKELFAESFAAYTNPQYGKPTKLPDDLHLYFEQVLGKHPNFKQAPAPTAASAAQQVGPGLNLPLKGLKVRKLTKDQLLALTPEQVSKLPPGKRKVYWAKIAKVKGTQVTTGKIDVILPTGPKIATAPSPTDANAKINSGAFKIKDLSKAELATLSPGTIASLSPVKQLAYHKKMKTYFGTPLPPGMDVQKVKKKFKNQFLKGTSPSQVLPPAVSTGGPKQPYTATEVTRRGDHDEKFFATTLQPRSFGYPGSALQKSRDELVKNGIPDRVAGVMTNWTANAPQDKKASVKTYTGSSYHKINKECWTLPRDKWSPDTKKHVDNINSLIDTHGTLPEPIRVFRGAGTSDPNGHQAMIKAIQSAIDNDGHWEEKGVTSTSVRTSTAQGFSKGHPPIILEIKAKKGLWVDPISLNSGEAEMLQKAGTKYKPTRMFKTKMGYSEVLVVQCEEL